MKKAGIYKILNLVNGKFYIGSAKIFERRFWFHRWCLNKCRHQNSYLQRSFNKYGADAFEFIILEVIENATKEKLLDREQYYIDTLKPDYNILLIAVSSMGTKRSDEFREKLRIANTGKKHSAETRLKISKVQIGRKASEETKAKMSQASKGRIISEETRKRMSAGQKGKIPTQSQRKAVSEANKKRVGVKYNIGIRHNTRCKCENCLKIKNEKRRINRKENYDPAKRHADYLRNGNYNKRKYESEKVE